MPEFYAHDGTPRKAVALYVHDGAAVRTVKEAWYHDGSAARKVFTNAAAVSQSGLFLNNTGPTVGTYSATLTIVGDGSLKINGTTIAAQWFDPITAGIGASYWVKLTSFTGLANHTGLASPASITSVGTTFNVTNHTTSSEDAGTYTLTIYSDAGGTNAVATLSGSYDVGRAL